MVPLKTDLPPRTAVVTITLYGNQGRLLATEASAISNTQPSLLLVPAGRVGQASIARQSHLRNILNYPVIIPLNADGVEVPLPSGSVTMSTRDCPTVVLVNEANQHVVVLHCGRDQLLKQDGGDFITDGLSVIDHKGEDRASVRAYIVGGIGAEHFAHNLCPEKVESFYQRFGASVFHRRDTSRWQLDLVEVIYQLLTKNGIGLRNIFHDGLCTYTNAELGSRRAEEAGIENKKKSNWVLVTRNQNGSIAP